MPAPAQIGPYILEHELGRGGMGVVYLARDSRLDRPVAIKFIPDSLAADPERLARLGREARMLAALNHPNIATIYGIEEVPAPEGAPPRPDGHPPPRVLVLEYAPGPTLAEQLASGALPVEDALRTCVQIASGLEAAHEQGVVHRDLKPDNIKLAPGGAVKILDFGLARQDALAGGSRADSATIKMSSPTREGMVMGTPGYMSPEQCRAKPVDKRTDIWAFGTVLFECLTGRMAFTGETATDAIAAILEREPHWEALPTRTPHRVRDLLRHCLKKDPRERLRDIGDARLELEEILATRAWTTGVMAAAGGAPPARRRWLVVALTAVAAGIAAVAAPPILRSLRPPAPHSPAGVLSRLSIVLPPSPRVTDPGMELSPDGRALALIGITGLGGGAPAGSVALHQKQIYLRRFDDFELHPLPESVGATGLSFSPDGRWLAFTWQNEAGNRWALRKISLAGGAAVTLCEVSDHEVSLPAWADDGRILIIGGHRHRALLAVPQDGGDPQTVFDFNGIADNGIDRVMPLPGAQTMLLNIPISDKKGFREATYIVRPRAAEQRILLDYGAPVAFLPTGHILFTRADTLLAAPFDPVRGEVTGGAVPLLAGLRTTQGHSATACAVSPGGCLAYAPGGRIAGQRRLALVDRAGAVQPLSPIGGDFEDCSIPSPDGKLITGSIVGDDGLYQLYVCDVEHAALRRLSVPGFDSYNPRWMPDGRRIVFACSASGGADRVMLRRADGADQPQVLTQAADPHTHLPPISVDPDGSRVLCGRRTPSATTDLILVSTVPGHKVADLLATPAEETDGHFSPDGRWIAYTSDESGRPEIYIRAAPPAGEEGVREGGGRWRISPAGGARPQWSPDGKEIFYLETPDRLVAVDVTPPSTPDGQFVPGTPRPLFSGYQLDPVAYLSIMPDGKHFVFIQMGPDESRVSQINIVQNWLDEFRNLAATGAPR